MIHRTSTLRRSVTAIGIAVALSACSTAQRIDTRGALTPDEHEEGTLEATLQPTPHVLIDPPREFAPDTLVDHGEAESENSPEVVEEVLDALALETKEDQGASESVDPAQILRDASEDDLVRELEARVLRAWQIVAKASGPAGADAEFAELQRQAATRLLALTFLRDDLTSEGSNEALTALATGIAGAPETAEAPVEYRLLAAAHVARSDGDRQQIEALINDPKGSNALAIDTASLSSTVENAEDIGVDPLLAVVPSNMGFRVVRMTFAKAIDGPGEFCTLPSRDVKPGNTVYIYGEFEDFAVTAAEDGKADTNVCAFSASFELVDEEGGIVEELEFLSAKHGRQHVATSTETVNFWARYRIPKGLEPGRYHLRIRATDRIGNAQALSQLGFAVAKAKPGSSATQRPPSRP